MFLSSESSPARSGETAEQAHDQLPRGSGGHAVDRPGRRHLAVAGVVVVGLLLLLLGGSLLARADAPVTPRLVEGWAMPNASGTAISLHRSETGGSGQGYVVAGASWVDADNVWHSGAESPTCIGTNPRTMTAVQLSVVTVALDDGTQWDHVVHLRCLG